MKKIIKKFNDLPLSKQIFGFIITFITVLVILLFLLNKYVFLNIYNHSQLSKIETETTETVEKLKNANEIEYYDILYDHASTSNSMPLILNSDLEPINSEYSYSIEVTNSTTYDKYILTLPNLGTEIQKGERVRAKVFPKTITEQEYSIASLTIDNRDIYNLKCDYCHKIEGIVTTVNTPPNLNFYFAKNQVVISELYTLKSNTTFLTESPEFWQFTTDTEFSQNVVFVHQLNNSKYLMTIYTLQTPYNLARILNNYNLTMYAIIIIFSIVVSVAISNYISKPIKELDMAAKRISELDFCKTNEGANAETQSLSKSINKISYSFKKTLNDLNQQSGKIYDLYENQTKQINLRNKFLSSISHELKTPLMVINITAQAIMDGIFTPEEEKLELDKILKEINNLDGMIKDLLDVYRLDELALTQKYDKISLKQITLETLKSVSKLIETYNQNLTTSFDRNTTIYGDSKQIAIVVSNLITNAIKYTPKNGTIEVLIVSVKDKLVFKIKNYGITIPEDLIEHLFEPFYRVDDSRTKDAKTKGTGLGLYIVSETLKAHNFDFGIHNIQNGVESWFSIKKNQKK